MQSAPCTVTFRSSFDSSSVHHVSMGRYTVYGVATGVAIDVVEQLVDVVYRFQASGDLHGQFCEVHDALCAGGHG